MEITFTVALADRSALVRNMVDAVCERYGLQVVGEASTSWQLIALCQTRRPDLVVADSDLGDGPIEECIDRVLATGAKVVILCDDDSTERLTGLLERGVSGYLLHDSSPDHVGEGLLAVAAGAAALHPTVTDTILKQWRRFRLAGPTLSLSPRSTLTPRELDVLAAMADGLATKAIAIKLGVALKTVENHKIRIFDKLGVSTQAEAVSLAIGHCLLAGAVD
jgi:two-component system, NarL family, nitrate/nitrite response regulator NarL